MYEQLQMLATWLAKAADLWSGLMAFVAVAGAGMAAGMAIQARRAKRLERAAIRQLVMNGLVHQVDPGEIAADLSAGRRSTWQTGRPWWGAGGAEVAAPGGDLPAPIHHAPPVAKARRAEPPQDRPNALGSCKSDGWIVEVSDR